MFTFISWISYEYPLNRARKLRLKFGPPFRKPVSVFGFPQQFLGFLSENQSLRLSVGLTNPEVLVENPDPRIGFLSPFLGVPDIRKPSNSEPCLNWPCIFLCNYRAVGSMIFTLFFPLIPFVLEIIVCFYWGASALYLASMGDSTFTASNETMVNSSGTVESVVEQAIAEIPCDPNVSFVHVFYTSWSHVSWGKYVRYSHLACLDRQVCALEVWLYTLCTFSLSQ